MSITWIVWPLDDQMKAWLSDTGVDYPDASSRFPTGNEIKDALSKLHEYEVKIYDNGLGKMWQARVTQKGSLTQPERALLEVTTYTGDDQEQKLHFGNGCEALIKRILALVAAQCGPLVLIAQDTPQVISAS